MIDPREIDEVKFEAVLRGYSMKEVDHYLEELCDRIAEENKQYDELERKYAALKIQIEDIKSAAEEEHAECERILAEAKAELERARGEADRIIAAAREEEKQSALRTKFSADKAIAAAKREAMLITDEAKQKANTVELASHRAADSIIGDAKKAASVIVRNAKMKSEELILNAQASVEGERRLFMKLREEIIARSGEFSKILTGQLTDIAQFADRVRRTNFGDIPTDRDELIGMFAAQAKVAEPKASEEAPEKEIEEVEAVDEPVEKASEELETEPETDSVVEEASDEAIAEEEILSAPEESPVLMEDDDTYDFAGYPDEVGASAFQSDEIPTAEYDGLPQTGSEKIHSNSPRPITEEEIDRIFSFDVEEILNSDM